MSIMVHKEHPLSVATVSGGWSANTPNMDGILMQVTVKPTTLSTMYDFRLIDSNDDVVYERTDYTGKLNEEVSLPIKGIYTMKILNSTRDESYDVLVQVRES